MSANSQAFSIRGKYNDAAIYLLTYHGVLCPQARDLFSAGSVALRSDPKRGGLYIMRALMDTEDEMRRAAAYLEDALFVEYWGASVPPKSRIREWLKRADKQAGTWKPSEVLFLRILAPVLNRRVRTKSTLVQPSRYAMRGRAVRHFPLVSQSPSSAIRK